MAWSQGRYSTKAQKDAAMHGADVPARNGGIASAPSFRVDSAPATDTGPHARTRPTCFSTVIRELKAQLFDPRAADSAVRFKKLRKLGAGSFGSVWLCEVCRFHPAFAGVSILHAHMCTCTPCSLMHTVAPFLTAALDPLSDHPLCPAQHSTDHHRQVAPSAASLTCSLGVPLLVSPICDMFRASCGGCSRLSSCGLDVPPMLLCTWSPARSSSGLAIRADMVHQI
eukprot:jgi/Ulvmu1/5456/UM227_0001.1